MSTLFDMVIVDSTLEKVCSVIIAAYSPCLLSHFVFSGISKDYGMISSSTVFTVFIEMVVMRPHDDIRNSSDLMNTSRFIQSCTGHSHMIKFTRAMTGRFYATTFLKFLSTVVTAKPVKHSKLTDKKLQPLSPT